MLFIYVEIVYFLNKFNNLYQGEERPEKTTQRPTTVYMEVLFHSLD